MDIFVKGNAPKPQHNPNHQYVDHETGLIHRPKMAPVPLVGPTTGSEYEQLKKAEKQNQKLMLLLERQMRSTFQCTQCKKKWPGKFCRIKWRTIDGVNAETLVCPNQKCDGPVIMIEDAMNLRKAPGGRI